MYVVRTYRSSVGCQRVPLANHKQQAPASTGYRSAKTYILTICNQPHAQNWSAVTRDFDTYIDTVFMFNVHHVS